MPRTKSKTKSKRTYKKKVSFSKVERMIKKQIEVKSFDTAGVASQCDYNGGIITLCEIAQGTDFNQRLGRRINVKSVQIKGYWSQPNVGAASVNRIMLFSDSDLQDSGTLPVPTDVLETVATAIAPVSLRENDTQYMKRFKIYWDNICVTVKGQENEYNIFNYYKEFEKGHHIQFSGTGASDSAQGTLMLCVASNLVTTNLPNITYMVRIRYYDA